MKLDTKALAIVAAILWGGSVLLIGIANLIWETYGTGFLDMVASVYPGYHGPDGFGSVIVGTLYALVDGAVAGWLFGWLYNMVAGGGGRSAA